MSPEETLYSVLSNDSAVLAYVGVGSPLEAKIYPMAAPTEVDTPFIIYHLIGARAFNKLTSAPSKESKMLEIACVSDSYSEAKGMAEAIKVALGTDYGYLDMEGDEYFPDTQKHRVYLHWSLIG